MKKISQVLAVFVLLGMLLVSGANTVQASTHFTKLLALGSSGSLVTDLQTVLSAEGVYTGPITGYFGTRTRDSVKTLQAKYGLDSVGVVGPKTRLLLNQLFAASIATTTSANAATMVQPTSVAGSSASATTPAAVSNGLLNVDSSVAAVIGSTSTKSSRRYQQRTHTRTVTPPATVVTSGAATTSAPVIIPTPILAPTPTPTTTPPQPVSTSLQWGVFPGDSTLSSVESLVGKQANIEATFANFSDSFPTYLGSVCASDPHKTLLVFWENYNYSLDNIIAGAYDGTIRSFAQQTASYQCPVIISLFHEMNGNWDSWDGTMPGNSPAKIIAAWKHVHDIFAAVGVSNVKWAWVVNNDSVPDVAGNQYSDYYPGDAYVDYVGVDGFNFGNPWETFGQVFDSAMAKLQTYNKPIYIFSMASVAGSQKAAWITEGLGTHVKTYQNLKGWVWFDQNGSDGNWLLNSDAASLTAFKAILP